jgi:hypothetical protein
MIPLARRLDERRPRGVRTIAPCPAGFQMTPEWHRAFAHLLRLLDDPKALVQAIEYRRRRDSVGNDTFAFSTIGFKSSRAKDRAIPAPIRALHRDARR